jgi:hypothetical protein
MQITSEDLHQIIKEELSAVLAEESSDLKEKEITDPCVWKDKPSHRPPGISQPRAQELCAAQSQVEEAAKKPCKPSKGKRFAKRVDGKCRSFGQKGNAKGGGDRIRPGTKKGDAYCARSLKIKKCKNPPCANALSRKKWKCKGAKSQK